MPSDENLKNIFEYIFIRKGRLRAKTIPEAILAAYLISIKASNPQSSDENRGAKASQEFTNLKKDSQVKKILNNIKINMDTINIKKVIKYLKQLVKFESIKEYIKNEPLTKNSVFSKPTNLEYNEKLKTDIKDELNRYNDKHKGIIPNDVLTNIKDDTDKDVISTKNKIRKHESYARQKIENQLEICDSIYNKNYESSYERTVLHQNVDYVDCLYISTKNKTVHRIIVGKKGTFNGKEFKTLNSKDKSLNKRLNNIMQSNDDVYKFSKIAEGKTKEKYEHIREDNNQKKEFSYRYRVYCSTVNEGYSNSITNLNLAPQILEKLGYKIKYKGDKNKEPNYGALGKGSFNAAYEEENNDKKIKRVIKICISSYEVVTKERKGNNKGCKAFHGIESLNTSGKNISELFYQNKDLVLSKNKEFGQVSTLIKTSEDLWYCISTSEFRSDGDAEEFNKSHIEKFKSSETEKLIELQAFTKGILNGLVRMHRQGVIHLDVKPANTLKKSLGRDSAPYYKYSLTDFGTAVDIGKRIQKNTGNNWDTLLDGIRGVGTPIYMRSTEDIVELKEITKVQPKLIYKLDSFTVGTSMCIFYKFYLNGMIASTFYEYSWDWSNQLNKGPDSEYISWLPDGYAKDLAKKLMELDMTKRLSCEEALRHPFITKTIVNKDLKQKRVSFLGRHRKGNK